MFYRMTVSTPPIGIEAIKDALRAMPTRCGVYRMTDASGEILYIGKAKNLKNRLSNYANANGLTYRILRMVSQVVRVDITLTQNEAEALLLEATLIKKHSPRYNILLKDDKSFPSIVMEGGHDFPRIRKHRGAQTAKDTYFGPFASVSAVNQTLTLLQKIFLLRPCADNVFAGRTRPCLQYQIKRCSAPCVGYISKEAYAENLSEAAAFLKGKSRTLQERFAAEMQAYSEAQDYEKAALMRDRIRALTQVQQEQRLHASNPEDADIIALEMQQAQSCIQVLFYRGGHHFGSQSYFPRYSHEETPEAVLSAFLGQFYQMHTPAPEVLVNLLPQEPEILQQALALRAGRQVQLRVPQRGHKRSWMQQAQTNAALGLKQHIAARMNTHQQLEALGKLFALSAPPQRIEVYDNSHIMGQHALGAMIVATPEGFDKKSYRRFNSKDTRLSAGDDYGMMREMFSRRFQRLLKEDPERKRGNWPDLVLIDGGQGQLNAVSQIFAELGVSGIAFCAIAKGPDRNAGRETFFVPNQQPFTLPPADPALHFLQRLRDEAHRFAIGSHRQKRAKSLTQSSLDDIPGVGSSRKRALMRHFGSKAGVEQATITELEKVDGINKKVAQLIYDYYHG